MVAAFRDDTAAACQRMAPPCVQLIPSASFSAIAADCVSVITAAVVPSFRLAQIAQMAANIGGLQVEQVIALWVSTSVCWWRPGAPANRARSIAQ